MVSGVAMPLSGMAGRNDGRQRSNAIGCAALPVLWQGRENGGLRQVVRFGAVGVVNTLADIAVFWLLIKASLPPAIANVLSYSCGVVVSFSLNRVWTFRRAGTPGLRAVVAVRIGDIGSLVVSTAAVGLGALFMPPLVAKLASFPVSFAWNFCFSRYWVFIHRRGLALFKTRSEQSPEA